MILNLAYNSLETLIILVITLKALYQGTHLNIY